MRIICGAGARAGMEAVFAASGLTPTPDLVDRHSWLTFVDNAPVDLAQYLAAQSRLVRVGRVLGAFFEDLDVLLTPVLNTPTLPIGSLMHPETAADHWQIIAGETHFPLCGVLNVTGQPAASIPSPRPRGCRSVCRRQRASALSET